MGETPKLLVLHFMVKDIQYCLNIVHIDRVMFLMALQTVPGGPADLAGLMNLRGKSINEALSQAAEHKPGVVFMDYNLEDVNGVEVAIAMQQQNIEARYILLTGDVQNIVMAVASQAGFHDVLQKPVSPEKIIEIYSDL